MRAPQLLLTMIIKIGTDTAGNPSYEVSVRRQDNRTKVSVWIKYAAADILNIELMELKHKLNILVFSFMV
jgi:hypothetical protein